MSRFTKCLMAACLGVSMESLLAMNEGAHIDGGVLFPSSCCQLRQDSRKFKLGIELQEIGSLCSSMEYNFPIQKKPIFFTYWGHEKLLELQIDGNDIE